MAKVIACRDGGINCDWVGRAESEEELMKKIVEHAKQDHHLPLVPQYILQKAKALIREE